MQAFDTNVVVRLVLGDDPQQAALAVDIWRNSLAQGNVYLSQIVLIEVAWALAASAKFDRDRIASELHRLTSIDGVVIEHEPLVLEALECYQNSSADCQVPTYDSLIVGWRTAKTGKSQGGTKRLLPGSVLVNRPA